MVRKACAPSVEKDEARERGETTQKRRCHRPLPDVVHMEQPANQHEIDWAVSDRLERDVDTVYRLRVASLRDIHARILPSARLDRNTNRRLEGQESVLIRSLQALGRLASIFRSEERLWSTDKVRFRRLERVPARFIRGEGSGPASDGLGGALPPSEQEGLRFATDAVRAISEDQA